MFQHYKDKLNNLTKKFTDPSNIEWSKEMFVALEDLEELKKFHEHPLFQRILKQMNEKIEGINIILSTNENLSDFDRKVLFKNREVWQFVFNSFGGSDFVSSSIDKLKILIDEMVEKMK